MSISNLLLELHTDFSGGRSGGLVFPSLALTGRPGSVSWGGHCSFLLGPGAHKVLFVPSKSLFPQCCGKSVIKSHWPLKSDSLGVLSQSLCWMPRLAHMLWVLEVSPQCENSGIIVLRFVRRLLSGSVIEIMSVSSKRT